MFGKLILIACLAIAQGEAKSIDSVEVHNLLKDARCPEEEVHYLLPHEWNCSQFYYCEYGYMRTDARVCPGGTYFSPELQVCVHPLIANCNLPNVPPEETITTEQPTTSTAEPTTTTTETPTTTHAPITTTTAAPIVEGWHPNGCPVDYRVEQLLPHPTESNLYYQCANGELVLRECAVGTHFNFEEQRCDLYGENESGNGDNESGNGDNESGNNDNGNTESEGGDSENETEASTTTQAPATEAPIVEGWHPNGCPVDYRVEQLLPHPTESNLYYQCAHGELVLRECAVGTHFNFEEQRCDLYGENESGNGDNESGNGDNESGNNDNGNTESEGGDSENETEASTTTQAPATEAPIVEGWHPNGCPVDYRVEQLLPHPTESNLYYQCAHGELVLRECAVGTHFNFEEQRCDVYGENESGNGDNESGNGDNESGNNDNGNTESEGGDSENENEALTTTQAPATEAPIVEGWHPNGCPVDYRVEQLFPHPTESNLYYQCVHDELVLRECAVGTHFNFEEQMCSLYGENESGNNDNGSGNGENESGNGGNESGDNDNDSGNGDNESGNSDNGDHGSGGQNDNECPSDYTQELLLPHSDCGKFYQCTHGQKVEKPCPAGLHFSFESQRCEWPFIAGCESGSGDNDNGDNGNGENGNGDNGNGENGNGDNGNGENESGNGGNESEDNDNDSGNGDNESGNSDNGDHGSGGQNDNECPSDYTQELLLPHSDCGKFYQCTHGQKVERPCPAGLHFSFELQRCEWSFIAGCESGSGDNDNGDNGNGENGNGDNGNGENGNGDNGDNGNGENGNGNICATSCNVTPWAHETDCDKYWWCDGETSTLAVCTEGLHFNANTKTCDFISNAECIQNNIQATVMYNGVRVYYP